MTSFLFNISSVLENEVLGVLNSFINGRAAKPSHQMAKELINFAVIIGPLSDTQGQGADTPATNENYDSAPERFSMN